MRNLLCAALVVFLFSCGSGDNSNNNNADAGDAATSSVPVMGFTVVNAYPHDTAAFTQGLAFYKGKLYESTGNKGFSRLREVDLTTGKVLREHRLSDSLFGEGVVVLNDTVYQLTWQEKKLLRYTVKDFKPLPSFPLSTEGWGITAINNELVVTDGSSNLYFYRPYDFQLLRTQGVTEDGAPDANLNELEYINGFIYANQWQYNYILKIDPSSGQVVGKMDLSALAQRAKAKQPGADVLNGIAYNEETKKTYVTGKWWPELYEIQFPF
mgnify:CR=1 FL=1